ncbi:hypothetical protein HMPREF0819_0667 [Streptococcus equinus ATCC 9812]|uniref:Uncharacterized protein n=1 Tax=Streptococcus equinus ATCC 9812 TaxID=525379 RepID=E8JNU4_STREI|nr:hypothetical protein HMPREF0819_0667 [Streptococcus equinus ATCC 9812]
MKKNHALLLKKALDLGVNFFIQLMFTGKELAKNILGVPFVILQTVMR